MQVVYSRKDRRINQRQQDVLKEFLNSFTKECMGKTIPEIKKKYIEYDKRWVLYAIDVSKTKKYIVYGDQFEVVVDEFLNSIHKLKNKVSPFIYSQYEKIYIAVKVRTIFQKIKFFFSNHFLRRSNA